MPKPPRAVLWVATFLAACGGGIEPDPNARRSGPPAAATLVGPAITAPVTTAVSMTVKVTDAAGVAVPNHLINFVVVAGGGSVFVPSVMTSATGEATNQWTLGPAPGEHAVEIRIISTAGTPVVLARITATARAGGAATLQFLSRSLARFIGAREALSRLVSDGELRIADAQGNLLPSSEATLSVSPDLTVVRDSASRSTPGSGFMFATAGALRDSVRLSAFEDFRASRWRVSFTCAASANCPTCESTIYRGLSDSTVYSRLPGRGPGATFRLFVTGAFTSFGDPNPPAGATSDSLLIEQEVNTLVVRRFNLTAQLARESFAPSRFSGGHLCPAGWTVPGPVIVESY